jgi:hypothetical protein
MPEYIAALCHMAGTELAPFESLNLTAIDDDEAVQKAVKWRVETLSATPLNQRTWLQVIRDGTAIHSQEIGQL